MAYLDSSADIQQADIGADVSDYFALLKPRVMSLVVFTALVGMLLAPNGLHPFVGLLAILSIAIGGGAAGALNMYFDADIDAIMSRTKTRPIPAGRIKKNQVLGFGLFLTGFSVPILGLATNFMAAGLLALTIFYYVVIYTIWLKRITPQNIVIGGAAGAFPVMIGWVAVTGSVSIEALVLFSIVFLWTPPHFWALALYKKGDYEAAKIPMLPNVAGENATILQIIVYSVLLAVVGVLPVVFGFAGYFYGAVASALGLTMIVLAIRLRGVEQKQMRQRARKLFTFSLSYLFVIFLVLLLETLVLRMTGAA
ncbi:MAG TPA: protoheme IX farnesyltransferase [Devosia sp.]|nr:protoheme IX farnesyltransferase [Devosia sp.]